jgi:phage tail sheath gpL-like
MTIRLPEMTATLLSAQQRVQNDSQKLLFIGQMTSAGTATSGTLYENIDNENGQDALFGKNSMLATMIRAAKYHNKISRIDAIPLADNGAGTQALGSIVFTGTATGSGTITVSIGSKGTVPLLQHVYALPIVATNTPTNIGDLLAAAITADTTCPVTAVNTTGSVALTAVHKGTEGNFISISVSGSATSVTYAVTGMTGGASDPSVTTLFSVVGDTRYQSIVYPSYVRSVAKTFLDARFNVDKKILDGVGFDMMTDTSANIVTAGNANNSQSIAIIANNKIATPLAFYTGSGIFEINTIIAAQIAAIRALRLTENVNIDQYVSATYGAKDAFGGMHIASLPYFNTILSTLPLEDSGKSFTDTELASLTAAGITTIGNNVANTSVVMGTTVTTYKTDGGGNTDVSFKYLEYVDTEVTCREYFYNNLRERFSQSRLTDGDIMVGYNMANEQIIKSFLTGLYVDLADNALVKIGKDVATGTDWLTYFKQNLTVVLDMALGKATVTMVLPIVTQLRIILMSIQVSFAVNG